MEIFPVFLFCFSTSITPGPNNIMLMSSGVNYGVKKSIPHLLGINIGFPLMIVAIGGKNKQPADVSASRSFPVG